MLDVTSRVVFVCADLHGCALCGIPSGKHPAVVHGLGHMPRTRPDGQRSNPPSGFVAPPNDLVRVRAAQRMPGGLPLAGIDPDTGQPNTHLVKTACRCGAVALAAPDQVVGARCGPCILSDIEQAESP